MGQNVPDDHHACDDHDRPDEQLKPDCNAAEAEGSNGHAPVFSQNETNDTQDDRKSGKDIGNNRERPVEAPGLGLRLRQFLALEAFQRGCADIRRDLAD